MGYLAIVALGQGKRAGFAVVAGVALGLLLLGFAGAWGVSEVLSRNESAYQILRISGIAFMLYLVWDAWRGSAGAPLTTGSHFLRGFINNVLNPKAALFYLAVLPKFTDPAQPLFAQTIVLTLSYVAIATVIHLAIVVGASGCRRLLENVTRERQVRRSLAIALLVFTVWFAFATAH